MYVLQLHGVNTMYVYIHTNYVMILPRQQWVLHETTPLFGPEQPFPPQKGAGLLHTLVRCRVPLPQLLLHDPYLHELHPP